jgi:hypothetical protein
MAARIAGGFLFWINQAWRSFASLSPQPGENSPNWSSRFEPLNRSSRRQEALTDLAKQMEPPDVGCYEAQGESNSAARPWRVFGLPGILVFIPNITKSVSS